MAERLTKNNARTSKDPKRQYCFDITGSSVPKVNVATLDSPNDLYARCCQDINSTLRCTGDSAEQILKQAELDSLVGPILPIPISRIIKTILKIIKPTPTVSQKDEMAQREKDRGDRRPDKDELSTGDRQRDKATGLKEKESKSRSNSDKFDSRGDKRSDKTDGKKTEPAGPKQDDWKPPRLT